MDSYWFDDLTIDAQHAVLDAVRATRGKGTEVQAQRARALDRDYGDAARSAYWEQIPFRSEAAPLGHLRLGLALRRIRCSHLRQGGMSNNEVHVRWCEDCGHSEVVLAPLAPDAKWLPEGKPAWNSADL